MLSKISKFVRNIMHAQENARRAATPPSEHPAVISIIQQNVMLTKALNDIRVEDRLIASMIANRNSAQVQKKKISGIQKNIDSTLLGRAGTGEK